MEETSDYKYVVVLSRYQGKLLLSQHRDRNTWETQGGHIEPGETPEEAARRENPVQNCFLWSRSAVIGPAIQRAAPTVRYSMRRSAP